MPETIPNELLQEGLELIEVALTAESVSDDTFLRMLAIPGVLDGVVRKISNDFVLPLVEVLSALPLDEITIVEEEETTLEGLLTRGLFGAMRDFYNAVLQVEEEGQAFLEAQS